MKAKLFIQIVLFTVMLVSCKKKVDPIVKEPGKPVALLTGDWNVKENCSQSGAFSYQVNIKREDTLPNALLIKNLYEIDQYIACILSDGDSCKLEQSAKINGFPVIGVMKWGVDDSLRIQYVIQSTAPENCSVVMGR